MEKEKNNKDIFLVENKDEDSTKEEDKDNENIDNINYKNLISYEPKTTLEILKEDKKKIWSSF